MFPWKSNQSSSIKVAVQSHKNWTLNVIGSLAVGNKDKVSLAR